MAKNDVKLYDGFTSQAGGMNIGRDGSQLGAKQYRLLVNGTARGDFITQRPGFRKEMVVLPSGAGFFQHGGWLRMRHGKIFFVAVVGGRFYRVDPDNQSTVEFTIPGDPNPSTLTQGWSIPGGAQGFRRPCRVPNGCRPH